MEANFPQLCNVGVFYFLINVKFRIVLHICKTIRNWIKVGEIKALVFHSLTSRRFNRGIIANFTKVENFSPLEYNSCTLRNNVLFFDGIQVQYRKSVEYVTFSRTKKNQEHVLLHIKSRVFFAMRDMKLGERSFKKNNFNN
jgi:hypothetical protein